MANILRRSALSRRALLRGAGAAIALPFLSAMVPALPAADHPAVTPIKRFGFVFLPMGADMSRWTPAGASGALGDLPFILQPLNAVRAQVNVLSNVDLQPAYPGSHATSNSAFLSAARAKHTESNDYRLGTTIDQRIARHLLGTTQLPSLELAMDMIQVVGQCDNGYACVYQNNLSWSSPTTPLPAEAHPRLVFEQLFGEGGTPAERRAALQRRASLLDLVKDDFTRLAHDLGPGDRAQVDSFLTAVREVERRIHKAEADVADNPLPDLDRPIGVPASYAEHARLMFALQRLALQGDVTRVISFQLARETSNRTYPESGVADPHHPLSHHGNDPAKIERLSKINRYHVDLFAEFVRSLHETPDGAGTLLDHTAYLFGSGMGNPNVHDHSNLPVLLAGGRGIGLRTGQHLRWQDAPLPLANVHETLLRVAGVGDERFGDSTGVVAGLLA